MKNFSRRLIAGFCCAALAATMTSFGVSADETSLNSYEADSSTVKLIGRTERVNDSLWLTYTDSGVEFKCSGTQVKFNVRQSGNDTRVAVYVNGKVAKRGMVSGSNAYITVDLEEGENTVKLIKLSESAQSVFAIDSIETDSETITPTEANAHKIEFIGDSITCGYGADGTLKNSFSTATENGSETYAYQTALNFGADYSMVSVSGIGVVSGYTSNGQKNETGGAIMPPIYTKTGFSWSWLDSTTPSNFDWDFTSFDTDLVVINLGTNDYNYTKADSEKCKEFEESYESFLKTVRENNPDAEILCVLGLMGQNLYTNIENAVEAYKTDEGDEHITTFKLSQISVNDGYGVDYHPNTVSHQKAADELTAKISELYGWSTVENADEGNYTVTKEYTFTNEGESFVSLIEDNTDGTDDSDGNDENVGNVGNDGNDETGDGDTDGEADGETNGDGDTNDNEGDTDTDENQPAEDEDTDNNGTVSVENPVTGGGDEDGDTEGDEETGDGEEEEEPEEETEDTDGEADEKDEDKNESGSGSDTQTDDKSENKGNDSKSDDKSDKDSSEASTADNNSGKTASSNANSNPATGAAESFGALALLGGAAVILKKKR